MPGPSGWKVGENQSVKTAGGAFAVIARTPGGVEAGMAGLLLLADRRDRLELGVDGRQVRAPLCEGGADGLDELLAALLERGLVAIGGLAGRLPQQPVERL